MMSTMPHLPSHPTARSSSSLRPPLADLHHHLGLLVRLVGAQVRSQLQYRVSFTMDVVSSVQRHVSALSVQMTEQLNRSSDLIAELATPHEGA